MREVRSTASAILALCAFVQSVAADEVADFYRGKTVSVVVGHEVGTGFDIYARTLARHLGRHIAGGPNVVVQNMVGASGIIFTIGPDGEASDVLVENLNVRGEGAFKRVLQQH